MQPTMTTTTQRQLVRGEHLQPGDQIQFKLSGQWETLTLRRKLLPGSAGYGRECWQVSGHMLPITIEQDGCYAVDVPLPVEVLS
jgi:hypothetical protein